MIKQILMRCLVLLALVVLSGCTSIVNFKDESGDNEMKRFQELASADWQEVFYDSCTGDWTEQWILDGLKATVENGDEGMVLSAGPIQGDDSCHAVLWTKPIFEGDVRIDYEYTKVDDAIKNVNILYVLASGSGEGAFAEDIFEWNKLREIPSMRLYFNHMNTYHISYDAFSQDNENAQSDYIRGRRYMPETGQGLTDTELNPDHLGTGFFKTGVPHQIIVIKKGGDLFMFVRNDEQQLLCHWSTDEFPPVTSGRIGLRHMYTRSARYRDFRVSLPSEE